MTLYIYRVEWIYPARNPITRSEYIKISNCTRTLLGPVGPVGPTGQIGRLLPDQLQRPDRCSNWSERLLPILVVNTVEFVLSNSSIRQNAAQSGTAVFTANY